MTNMFNKSSWTCFLFLSQFIVIEKCFAKEHLVEIPGIKFAGQNVKTDPLTNQSILKVKLGDYIHFKNLSPVPHMINSFHPDLMWNLGKQNPNEVTIMRPPKKLVNMKYNADFTKT